MCNKKDYEVIYITPGWNRSIGAYHPKEYEEALKFIIPNEELKPF